MKTIGYRYVVAGLLALSLSQPIFSQAKQQAKKLKKINHEAGLNPLQHKKKEKMKVEIWSDVMCPFCYIGKRKFESALAQFGHADSVEIVWKSFQLNPGMKTDPSKNTIEYLAEVKGWTLDQAKQTTSYVINMANEVGLHYDFDKAVVANSFDAHRFIQYAKKNNKGDAAEESLFKAYFTEGKNTADHAVLIQLGTDIGLNADDVKAVLSGNDYAADVDHDISEAQQIGVTGVPFFVFNRKYAVSGAQPPETFLNTLNKAWSEQPLQTIQSSDNGASCDIDGNCK